MSMCLESPNLGGLCCWCWWNLAHLPSPITLRSSSWSCSMYSSICSFSCSCCSANSDCSSCFLCICCIMCRFPLEETKPQCLRNQGSVPLGSKLHPSDSQNGRHGRNNLKCALAITMVPEPRPKSFPVSQGVSPLSSELPGSGAHASWYSLSSFVLKSAPHIMNRLPFSV